MPLVLRRLCPATLLLFAACSSSSSDIPGPDPSSGDVSPDTEDSPPADSGSADETSSRETASDGGPRPPDLGPCARLPDCLTAIGQLVTPAVKMYGPNGTCWDEFEAEQCWQDCVALLGSACESEFACCECETYTDCSYDDRYAACVAGHCSENDFGCSFALACGWDGIMPYGDSCNYQICNPTAPCLKEADAFIGCGLELEHDLVHPDELCDYALGYAQWLLPSSSDFSEPPPECWTWFQAYKACYDLAFEEICEVPD